VRLTRRRALSAGAAIGAAGLAGCVSVPGASETKTETRTYADVSAVSVENTNGDVAVTGEADRRAVSVTITMRTRFGRRQFENVQIVDDTSGGALSLRTQENGSGLPAPVSVTYDVRVPRDVSVTGASTSNGSVRVTEVAGDPLLRSTNGSVTARGVDGYVAAATTNGAVSVGDVGGLDGAIASNGSITAAVPALRRDVVVATSNGPITLSLARTLDAAVDAQVSNGTISVRGLSLSNPEVSDRRVRGTLGAGTHALSVRTSNGRIDLTPL